MILIDEIVKDHLIRMTTRNGVVQYKCKYKHERFGIKWDFQGKKALIDKYGEIIEYLPDLSDTEWLTRSRWGDLRRMTPDQAAESGYYDEGLDNYINGIKPGNFNKYVKPKEKDTFYFYPLGDGLYKIGISTTDNVTWRMRSVRDELATVNVEPKLSSSHQPYGNGGWGPALYKHRKIHSKWMRSVGWRTYHTPTASLLESEVKKFLKDCQVCKFGTDEQKAHLGTSDGYTEVYSLSDFDIEMLHFLIDQHGCRETTSRTVNNWDKFWNSYPSGESDAF